MALQNIFLPSIFGQLTLFLLVLKKTLVESRLKASLPTTLDCGKVANDLLICSTNTNNDSKGLGGLLQV